MIEIGYKAKEARTVVILDDGMNESPLSHCINGAERIAGLEVFREPKKKDIYMKNDISSKNKERRPTLERKSKDEQDCHKHYILRFQSMKPDEFTERKLQSFEPSPPFIIFRYHT